MESIVEVLAYPTFEASIIADQIGSGLGVSLLALFIFVVSVLLCVDKSKANKINCALVVCLFLPYVVWYLLLQIFDNSGVGNYILELCALITLTPVFCLVFKIGRLLNLKFFLSFFALPQIGLFITAILMRLFMPLIGK